MISVGDTVKVTGKTTALDEDGDEVLKELIPIGTICTVTAIEEFRGKEYYEVTPLVAEDGFLYDANDLEKGHLEWVKDE